MIPYGRQLISEEDIQAVVDVLRSDFLTQGPIVPQFETALCAYTGASYGIATNSGTSALHIACRAVGLGPGDTLWTTPITFVASANCALYCGAEVDFVDIDPNTFNISIEALATKLEESKQTGKLPKILVAVHLCGLPCDMKAIGELSLKYGFHVIEDASHALGAQYMDKHIGSCQYSDISVFSFHPVKTITTGEGGMAMTNNETLARKLDLLRSHGITRAPDQMTHQSDGPWYYQQIDLGYNYRMTDIQAALGLSQLKKLDDFVNRRHKIAKIYDTSLVNLPIQVQHRPEGYYSGMHLYVIRLQRAVLKKSHKQIFMDLRQSGIGVNLHYIPVHTQPYYQKMGFLKGDFPKAEAYYEEAITLPMFPDLTDNQINSVVEKLNKNIK